MNIQATRASLTFDPAADRAERVGSGRATDIPAGRQTKDTDRVQWSADVALLAAAQRSAAESPDLRHDLIERVRAKLQAGDVGQDAEQLAERLIDHLLGS
ncbi:MAG: flagellar biosynthesis anti-sigma factor FlgM [Acidobacteriota bacterium]